MNKENVADKFKAGIDCSQVVLGYCAEQLGITREEAWRIASAFGGGMGIGETCGAVAGAMIAIGMRYGQVRENDPEQKAVMKQKRQEFLEEFLERYPSCRCREILKHDISDPEERQKILEAGLLFDLCPEVVLDAMDILDGIL